MIGSFVGALLALVPAALHPKGDRPKSVQKPPESVGRLTRENERLIRSHARLVDHIETLERELLLEQHLCAHWREEATRIAKQSREDRERRALHALHQQAALMAQYNQQNQQQGLMMQAAFAQNQQNAYAALCNCVPSRAQVWGANHGLVAQLNREE